MDPLATTSATKTNGESRAHELFALTDEQILEIEPQAEVPSGEWGVASEKNSAVISSEARNLSSSDAADGAAGSKRDSSVATPPRNDGPQAGSPDAAATSHQSPVTSHAVEPPAWLAAQMKDPWGGEEARELWNGVQQTKQEAAAYRAAIATPEDARALKELYPGGVSEARGAAERARLLEEIDRAYFGAPGSSAEQASASRAQLAERMLREDPAAFREMVFAGLRALEEAGKGSGGTAASSLPRLAQVLAANRSDADGAAPGAAQNSHESPVTNLPAQAGHESHLKAYAAFEKAANEDLQRSVGAAIARTIEQAVPNLKASEERALVGARHIVPLHERLGTAIRQDVEAALRSDRQLGEQIAQILSARRFDSETRAQVVRLIDDRARQLVPVAAKRVLNDWTQTTLAAHRGNAVRTDIASARRELPRASLPAAPQHRAQSPQSRLETSAMRSDARRVDYRKLSDEQILEL